MNTQNLRENLTNFELQKLFVENLGWEHPKDPVSGHVLDNGKKVCYSKIAEINRVPVLQFSAPVFSQFNANHSHSKKFHKVIKKKYNKHLLLFLDDNKSFTVSYFSGIIYLTEAI